ncbi:TRM-domain-containing protein [Aspergillus saccharolyticus JOP 1030-1]|uniref:tRNA (guanine(26)-N(2))-dimethyltransferase n=1 Tax=Aspergillus saccharolyticus JOP 1030-1 TaxID=1450539 RepID=A0A318ZDJ1_9EURO|nr:TRM-domain-containing protein [Aspergillus saccharolyticus JOP 1030-1]PYH44647.1 TRM-domain-containing protein [Aspergillus saccharolyticus JOP 1030-1]
MALPDSLSHKPEDVDTRSIISMREVDPSPVEDEFPELERGDCPFPSQSRSQEEKRQKTNTTTFSGLGLRGHSWDSWLTAIQKYSTYPPSLFLALHFANTSILPLATRSVSASENYLLLTRPLYQSPSLEHIVLTVPVLLHIISGIALRKIRASRRARLYGAETRSQQYAVMFWPRMSLQARLGYSLIPLLGVHVLVNRITPVLVDGGSSGVGLGYVAHGIARSPIFLNIYYLVFVAAGVWHFVGGWASWMGWKVTTVRKQRDSQRGSLEGYLGYIESEQRVRKQKRLWWTVNTIAAMGASIWLAGALGVIGRAGQGHGWEASGWNDIYNRVPIFGAWYFQTSIPPLLSVFLSRSRVNATAPFRRYQSHQPYPILRAMDTSEHLIQYSGTDYRAVKEGGAYILNPPAQDAASKATRKDLKADDESQSVFYNPIQQFNRDLSVLAIRAYGEHLLASKKQKAEIRRQKKAENGGSKSKKRKREDETNQAEDQSEQAVEPTSAASADVPSEQTITPSFTILDALSATGLRALRYAKEIPFASYVVANDLSESAIRSMKTNIEYNKLEERIRPNLGDARVYMYSLLGSDTSQNPVPHYGKFDVIDLDPYGSASPFIDAAVQAVKDGGLLCVTCTDAGVWASHGYPEKAFALYGGVPVKGPHCHEGGLRLIIHALAMSAAKYGLAIEPLLSLSIDFYARVFVRVHRSPAQVKFVSGNMMTVFNCDEGCGAWSIQPLTQTKQKLDKKGKPFPHFGFAQGPTSDSRCEHCGSKMHVGGPMWSGPLHNPHFIQNILTMLPKLDQGVYQTVDRIEGMLTTALEEDLNLNTADGNTSLKLNDAQTVNVDTTAIVPRVDPALSDNFPFYFSLSAISKVLRTATISIDAMRGALRHLGYRATRTHAKPNTIRTDAPWDVIWEIMREWVRQKSPIKEGALKPGSPGAVIMSKGRDDVPKIDNNNQKVLEPLRRELQLVLKQEGNLTDIVSRLEAALERTGAHRAPGTKSGAPTQSNGQYDSETSTPSPGSLARVKSITRPHPSTLEVVFDEALGKEVSRKRLVRYQLNPRENWGPLSRASGSG